MFLAACHTACSTLTGGIALVYLACSSPESSPRRQAYCTRETLNAVRNTLRSVLYDTFSLVAAPPYVTSPSPIFFVLRLGTVDCSGSQLPLFAAGTYLFLSKPAAVFVDRHQQRGRRRRRHQQRGRLQVQQPHVMCLIGRYKLCLIGV